MSEWLTAVQKVIDWIDEHARENPSLGEISKQIGYSPYYCSEQFHKIASIIASQGAVFSHAGDFLNCEFFGPALV